MLTVSERGFGKRTSAYEYRVTGRGGQGIMNIEMNGAQWPGRRHFPGGGDHQVMLVTDGRPDDPDPGPRHPDRRPQDSGRDPVQGRTGRAGGFGRLADRGS